MAAYSLEARQESLFWGQCPQEVLLSGCYVPLDVGRGGRCGREQVAESEHQQDALTTVTTALSQSQPGAGPLGLVGPSGVGKSTLLQRLLADWASATRLTQFAFVFPLALAELASGMRERSWSLTDLLSQQHPHLPAASLELVLQNPQALLFLLDGLDQDLLRAASPCSDPNQPAPLSALVSGLITRTLVPEASVLVTSRPQLSPLKRVEVQGFSRQGRREYVRQFFTDPQEAAVVLEHMERTVDSYDQARFPRFCWIVCSVYREALAAGRGLPQTLTCVFTDATIALIQRHAIGEEPASALLTGLGKMADRTVLKGAESCSQEEMATFGLPTVLSSAVLQEFLHPYGLPETEPGSFSFLQPAVAQFLLAVAYHRGCWDGGSLKDLLEQAAGKSDLLELFLAGLCDPSQRAPLEGAVGRFDSDRSLEFTAWLKDTTLEALESYWQDPHLRCFRLLHQRQDPSLVVAIIGSASQLESRYCCRSAQDSFALNYMVMCMGEMECLTLDGSDLSEEELHHLLPTMGIVKKIVLKDISFHAGVYTTLTAGLQRGAVCELDLDCCTFGDGGVQILCAGLAESNVQILKFSCNEMTEVGCSYVAGALCSSKLRLLNLLGNPIKDAGLVQLSVPLRSPQCQLQELCLSLCELTGGSMEALSSALCGGSSVLTSLDLNRNELGDSGMNHISSALRDPHCRLQSLNVSSCGLTEACCAGLSDALQAAGRALRLLDLWNNKLGDAGVQLLTRAFKTSDCVPQTLRLGCCDLGEQAFQELADVVRMEGSRLRDLDVCDNAVGDAAAKHLWEALQDPVCTLEHLDLEEAALTDACVAELCAVFRANRSLRSLDLTYNRLTDAVVPTLIAMAEESSTLQKLDLCFNNFSEDMSKLMDTCGKIKH